MNDQAKERLLDFISDYGSEEVLGVLVTHCDNQHKYWVERKHGDSRMLAKQYLYAKNRLEKALADIKENGPGSGTR